MTLASAVRHRLALAALISIGLSACGGSDTPLALATPTLSFTDPQSTYDLANYTQTGRYRLPVGSGANLLAEEASGITFNKDTGTFFVVGDGGTAVVQVSRTGVLIDSMTLAADASKPQGTYFYDPEGIAYLGGGKFALVEERSRQVNEFTYVPNTTLGASGVRMVKIGTTIGNIGIEGLSFDPLTGGFVAVKESGPSGVFQTGINFATGTASNGSPTTDNSTNLFDPTRTGLSAHNDIHALSNTVASTAPDYAHLLILSAPDGKVVKIDRAGNIQSTLPVSSIAQNEGLTMDGSGNIYVVSEIGGGPGAPEMVVYSPTTSRAAVGIRSNLYLTFNQPVSTGTGVIVLSNGAGDTRSIPVADVSQVRINGNTVTINPTADLFAGAAYSVTWAAGVFKDASGANAPAITGTSELAFATAGLVDTTAPVLVSASPAAGTTGVTSSRIVLTFNEPVSAGNGNLTLTNGAGDTRTIPIGDATQVTVSGNTTNINPSADLLRGFTYNLQFPAGVIKDASGNPFAGITNATTLAFSTAAAPPSTLAAGDLLFMAANADAVDAFAFVLLKPIGAGTTIGFSDRDYVAASGMPATGEAAYMWTADIAYPAGTIITIQTDLLTPVASKGSIQGKGGGISTSAETIYAFQGTITDLTPNSAGAVTVARFLAAINLGSAAGDIPAELVTAGAYLSFAQDNVRYNGSLDRSNLTTFANRVRNTANWVTDDVTAYPLTAAGSLFASE
jgi:uncharacterized protein YjiK/methionine-rich copper-binding protein CopC